MKTMNMGLIKALYLLLYLAAVTLLMTGCGKDSDMQVRNGEKIVAERQMDADSDKLIYKEYDGNRSYKDLLQGGVECWIGIKE